MGEAKRKSRARVQYEEVEAEPEESEDKAPEVASAATIPPGNFLRIAGGKVQIMEGERVVFTEEGQPNQYLKLVASGDLDEGLLDALTDFVKRQRKRLGLSPLPPPAFGKAPPTLLGGASTDEDGR